MGRLYEDGARIAHPTETARTAGPSMKARCVSSVRCGGWPSAAHSSIRAWRIESPAQVGVSREVTALSTVERLAQGPHELVILQGVPMVNQSVGVLDRFSYAQRGWGCM